MEYSREDVDIAKRAFFERLRDEFGIAAGATSQPTDADAEFVTPAAASDEQITEIMIAAAERRAARVL